MGRSSGLYLEDELFAFAKDQAAAHHGKKLNAYIVSLVERDRAGQSPGGSAPLIELARRYAPALAPEIEMQLERRAGRGPLNQARILSRLLDALLDALKGSDDFNPEAQFELFSNEQKFAEAIRQQPAILAALSAVEGGLRDMMLNEDAATPRPKRSGARSKSLRGPSPIVPLAKPDAPPATGS